MVAIRQMLSNGHKTIEAAYPGYLVPFAMFKAYKESEALNEKTIESISYVCKLLS